MTAAYWTEALEWLGGGIIVGYILRDLRAALVTRTGGKMTSNIQPPGGTPPATPRPAARTSSAHVQTRIIGVLILVAVVVSIILDVVYNDRTLQQGRDLHNVTACEARVDGEFIAAIKGRAAYGELSQAALTTLISSIPTSFTATTPAQFRVTFARNLKDYDATITRIEQDRPKLPPLPSQVCS